MVPPLPSPRSRLGRAAVVLVFLAFTLVLCYLSARANAVLPDRVPGSHTVAEVEAAMLRLVEPYKIHPVIAEPAYRLEIATAILDAARASRIPEFFLVGMFFRESSYAKAVVSGKRRGALGECGLGQLNRAARWWARQRGYNLKTIHGQAGGSAAWLAYSRDQCGGILIRGFAHYSTGRSCSPSYAGDVVKDRFAIWHALENGNPIPQPPPWRKRGAR
jgi:hypothetical protein